MRTLQLPANIDANKIEARMHDGILELRIPKTAEAHAHAIPIGKQEPKQMAESGSSKSEKSGERTETAAGTKASSRQEAGR